MPPDAADLRDMADAAAMALEYARDKTHASFKVDIQCQDAIVRRLMILGDAARRVSPETREVAPEIPWHRIIGLRNILVHDYAEVDMDIVWDTIQIDLAPLILAVRNCLKRIQPSADGEN
jgi:uncharacterized protein with HEPN domain